MHYRNPYTMFKKTLKSGTRIWYYSFYDINGKRRQLSTGQKTRSLASQVCHALYYSGAMYPNLPNAISQFINFQSNVFMQNNIAASFSVQTQNDFIKNVPSQNYLVKNQCQERNTNFPTFEDYTINWYVYDKCEYIQQKLLHGFKVTKFYAYRKRNDIENNLQPFFGKFTIDKIDESLIEKYIKYLKKEKNLANTTVNLSLKTLKLILSEAYKKGDIKKDISGKIHLLKNDTRTRGILTNEEVEKLLDKNHITDYWRGNKIYYGMNYLASKTGMRLGEIQGLLRENIFPDHILVEHSWNEMYGLGDTKNHKSRRIPIARETYDLLMEISSNNTDGDFVFSSSNGKSPANRTKMQCFLNRALEKIGISKEEKKERYISFHSWRHFVNSKLVNSGVPKSVVQSIIGHVNDDAMTEHYTHVSLDEQKTVLNLV